MFQKWHLNKLHKNAKYYFNRRHQGEVSKNEIRKEIEVHRQLIKFYTKNKFNSKVPHAHLFIQESLRLAALLGDQESQYKLSKIFFDLAKFWKKMKSSFYSADIHEQYAKNYYREAFAFLKAAEDQEYPLATRLHGLALINGWGIGKDEEAGFKLIVHSVDQEKAWDRATKIFEELGLNKPEFFASLTAMRKQSEQ